MRSKRVTGIKQFPTMSRNGQKMLCCIAVVACIAGTSIVMQRRAIRQRREENTVLRERIAGLAGLQKENEVLSRRIAEINTAKSSPDPVSHDLLRVRGQVGVLRRQLLELQHAHQLLEQLKENTSDPESLAQAIVASGLEDKMLTALLEQRELATRKLEASQEDSGAQDPGNNVLVDQVAYLKTKIESRSQGILVVLRAKTDSLKESLDALQSDIDRAVGNSR